MIGALQMMPLLVEASPGFAECWREFQAEWADETSSPHYLVLSGFARHMCSLLSSGDEEALRRIFAVIERLHIEGDQYVKEAATIGLLEDLQNTNLHLQSTSPDQFEKFLLPISAKWWKKVEDFWEKGKIITDD